MNEAVSLQSRTPWSMLEWEKDPPRSQWDRALVELGGHPLQSCLWGEARRQIDGIAQHRWLARRNGAPVWMIRLEEREVLGGKIAWAPRGPTASTAEMSLSPPVGFVEKLKAAGFSLLIIDPWLRTDARQAGGSGSENHTPPRTIWLDLSIGRDAIFSNFHTQMRKGIRRGARGGVRVATTADGVAIAEFVALCRGISDARSFDLRLTTALIEFLLAHSSAQDAVEAAQFVALKDGNLGSGIFALRAGANVHQIFGGTNRDLRRDRVGEACQWAVIEWALARRCTRYDLEGIDPVNNPSVYSFKKRLGGEEIVLCGHRHFPLTIRGRAMSLLARVGGHG